MFSPFWEGMHHWLFLPVIQGTEVPGQQQIQCREGKKIYSHLTLGSNLLSQNWRYFFLFLSMWVDSWI